MQKRTEIKGIGMLIIAILLTQTANALTLTISLPDFSVEGNSVTTQFTTNETGTYEYTILLDGEQVAQNNTYTWQTNYASAGQHTFTYIANGTSSSAEKTREIYIQDIPLDVSFTTPTGTYSTIAIPVEFTTSYPADICTYQFNDQEGIMDGQGTEWHRTIYSAQDGQQAVTVHCTTAWDQVTATREFTVDTTPPIITGTSPQSTVIGDRAELEVNTDEPAWCRYGIIDRPYSELENEFDNNNTMTSTVMVRELAQGEHRYHVKCTDSLGNANPQSTDIVFQTNLPPRARIEIDQTPPLKTGLYRVTLQTSEIVIDPQLTFSFQDSGGATDVALTGNGMTWRGYLQIPDNTGEKILIFGYSASDESGLEGTEITEGKIVLVDTIPPPAPIAIKIKQNNRAIVLEWKAESKDHDYFKIYESPVPDIDRDTEFSTTRETSFADNAIRDGQTRYYRISDVDNAGNEGPLSEEVSITFKDDLVLEDTHASASPETPTAANPAVLFGINNSLAAINRNLLQAEAALKNLQSLDDSTQEAMSILAIIADANARIESIRSAKSQAESMRTQTIDEVEAIKLLKKLEATADTALREMPRNAKLEAKTEYEQTLDSSDIENAAREYAIASSISDSERLVKQMKVAQDPLKIMGEVMQVRVQYAQGSKEFTIMRKQIIADVIEGDIIETIPKTIAQTTDDIMFSMTPKIINRDPVVSWSSQSLPENTIIYYVNGFVDISTAQTAKTILVPPQPEEVLPDQEVPPITGAVTGSNPRFSWELLLVLGGMLVVGMAAYYFLALKAENKYETQVTGEEQAIKTKEAPKPILHMETPPGDIEFGGQVTRMINEAHAAADNLMIEEAYKLGVEAMKAQERLGKEEKNSLEPALASLRAKFALHKAIEAGHLAIDQNDLLEAQRQAIHIKNCIESVDVGTPLFSKARQAYEYFRQASR